MSLTFLDHQTKFIAVTAERSRFAWFASPGVGKTIGMLGACVAQPMKSLVLAPKTVLRTAWERDGAKFPTLRVKVIEANTPKRAAAILSGEYDLAVTNYAMFAKHAEDFYAAGVRRLIVDESSKIRNHEAQITRKVHWFADRIDRVYLLTGTPAPNNGTEYWGPLRALGIDAGGASYWSFCYRYFTPRKRRIYKGGKPRDVIEGWNQTPEQKAALAAHLNKWAWFLHKNDCLDLPAKHDIIVPITLDHAETAAYVAARKTLRIKARDGSLSAISPNAATMKLRQITGGSVLVDGVLTSVGTSKLDALADILDSLGTEPVIVWAEFTHEVDSILALFKERGEPCASIDGRTSSKAGDTAAAFQRGDITRLVCHPAAAGHGITLTAASYAVYYSLSFSYEQYEQSRDRIHRVGQNRPCTYYHLTTPGTVDDGCLRVVQRKGAASEELRKLCTGDTHDDDSAGRDDVYPHTVSAR